MRSALPKMLHEVCGRPMVAWAVKAARDVGARDIVVVTGHGADEVEAALAGEGVCFARQNEQLGTGHAFLLGAAGLRGDADVLVLYGDSPMLSADTLNALRDVHLSEHNALTVLSSRLDDATGYGRIVRGEGGEVLRIVEQKAAAPEELRLTEFNSGVYLMDARAPELAAQIGNDNTAQEYYLTDLLALYRQAGARVAAYCIPDPSEVMGANDRVQLRRTRPLDAAAHQRAPHAGGRHPARPGHRLHRGHRHHRPRCHSRTRRGAARPDRHRHRGADRRVQQF
ncbi:MAG: NTP transferase domain-containing protein [Hymenobacter sp.]